MKSVVSLTYLRCHATPRNWRGSLNFLQGYAYCSAPANWHPQPGLKLLLLKFTGPHLPPPLNKAWGPEYLSGNENVEPSTLSRLRTNPDGISASRCILRTFQDPDLPIILYRSGPPIFQANHDDSLLLYSTFCCLSNRKSVNKFQDHHTSRTTLSLQFHLLYFRQYHSYKWQFY